MNLLFIVPLLSFIGFLIGILLKYVAREEIKFGKFGGRYFIWMKRILLFVLIVLSLFFADELPLLFLGIVIGFGLGFFLKDYFFLGLGSVIGFLVSKEALLLFSSLTFLYGLPAGSIPRRVSWKQIIVLIVSFFIPLLLLFFDVNLSLIAGIAGGGLFQSLIQK